MPPHPHWQIIDESAASYDDAGNITIRARETSQPKTPKETLRTPERKVAEAPKRVTPTLPHIDLSKEIAEFHGRMKALSHSIGEFSKSLAEEGAHQYAVSFAHGRSKAHATAASLWAFVTQPVWVIGRRNHVKETNRLALFLLDTVRFGGTFAAIFVALFVSLNYESFWKIVSTKLHPLQYVASVTSGADGITNTLREKLLRNPSLPTAGLEEGDLLAFLPPIGPPENRLIIPKLGLNVPLVTPSYDSLLREDWEALEKDIQKALEMGVVHHPGTARPGQAGNFFVTGHSSYYPWAEGDYKTVFARLMELDVGDEYWVYYGGDRHRYVITEEKEVRPSDVTVLDQPRGKRLSTLMTCTPVGTTLRRLILTAEEVDPQTGVALAVGEREHREEMSIRPQMLPI